MSTDHDVIVISDSDHEPDDKHAGYISEDSDILVVSVSSPPPEPPSSSQPRPWGDVSEVWNRSDDGDDDAAYGSDVEFLDADALICVSQSQRSGVASTSHSQARSSVSTSPGDTKRKSLAYSPESDSDDDHMVNGPKKAVKRGKKSDEEKAVEKAGKEAQKLAKKEEATRKKEEAAALKAAQKLANKTHKEANKLVSDKKTTLKDMIIELSPDLISSPLYAPLQSKMREFECPLFPIAPLESVSNSVTGHPTNLNGLDVKIIRWKRHIERTYDEHTREWIPVPEEEQYTRTEGTYLIYVTRQDVLRSFARHLPLGTIPSMTQQVAALRGALGPKHHIHLMLCGWKTASAGKNKTKEVRDMVERELVGLQVREGVFVEQVADEEEAVNWIYNMSADLGIKPHKLIERSHLPFCALASSAFKVGKTDEDTMTKMLVQLPRLTDPAAQAIVREFGTMNKLMEAFERAEMENRGPHMLANVVVPRTNSGKDVPRVLNKALSERLYQVLWGQDPKVLVN